VFISLLLASISTNSNKKVETEITSNTTTIPPSTTSQQLNKIIDDEWEYILKTNPGIK